MHANGSASEYVSADEAARILGVSPPTIVRAIRAGSLPATKLARSWRIRRADLAPGGTPAPEHRDPRPPKRDALALLGEARKHLDLAERAIVAEREGRA